MHDYPSPCEVMLSEAPRHDSGIFVAFHMHYTELIQYYNTLNSFTCHHLDVCFNIFENLSSGAFIQYRKVCYPYFWINESKNKAPINIIESIILYSEYLQEAIKRSSTDIRL